jgi:hypothetical protein
MAEKTFPANNVCPGCLVSILSEDQKVLEGGALWHPECWHEQLDKHDPTRIY